MKITVGFEYFDCKVDTSFILSQESSIMEKIFVQHFKAIINDSGMELPLKNLNILLGEQASGKSTLAKLIYFFKTLPSELVSEVISLEIEDIEDPLRVINQRLRRYFVYLFGSTRHLDDFKIRYTYPSGYQVRLSKDKNSGNLFINLGYGKDRLINFVSDYKERIQLLDPRSFEQPNIRERYRIEAALGREILGVFDLESSHVYVPASRNMTVLLEQVLKDVYARISNGIETLSLNDGERLQSQNELIIYRFLRHVDQLKAIFQQGGDFEGVVQNREALLGHTFSKSMRKHIDIIKEKAFEVLKGRYRSDFYGEKIDLGEDKYVFLLNSSSGQQETIRLFQDLFIAVVNDEPVFRVYEEPESHLFPRSQKAFMEAVASLLRSNSKNQIILPTHSPYTLLAIDNIIKAGEMVAKNPSLDEVVTQKTDIPSSIRIRFSEVGAWWIHKGEIISALSEEREGINVDFIDDIASEMETVYDQLLSIGYENADL